MTGPRAFRKAPALALFGLIFALLALTFTGFDQLGPLASEQAAAEQVVAADAAVAAP
jgi:hypothetical protein